METVIEFEPKREPNKLQLGYWRMVTIEPNGGPSHNLTAIKVATRAKAKEIAKHEGCRFVELAVGA